MKALKFTEANRFCFEAGRGSLVLRRFKSAEMPDAARPLARNGRRPIRNK